MIYQGTIFIPEEGFKDGDELAASFYKASNGLYVKREEDFHSDGIASDGQLLEFKGERYVPKERDNFSVVPPESRSLFIERATSGGSKEEYESWVVDCDPSAPISGKPGGAWKGITDGSTILIHAFKCDIKPGGQYFKCTNLPALVAYVEEGIRQGRWKHKVLANRKKNGGLYWTLGFRIPRAELIAAGLFEVCYLPK
jgi:hypothetical protein